MGAAFIAEHAEELRNMSAWKKDFSGEAQKLYEEWVVNYGEDGKLRFYRPVGYEKCNNSGYKGRLGLPSY